MTDALDTPRFQRLAEPWTHSTKLGSTLLVPGIRLLSLPSLGTFDQLQLLRDLPVSGYALFAAENFNEKLDEILISTQGKVQNTKHDPIPQSQPFQTAAFRYAGLQKEWQFLWEKSEQAPNAVTTSANFKNQYQELQNALNQLAILPSASNLISAKVSLTRF